MPLSDEINTALRAHVSNNMPIRLLQLPDMKMIERGDIFKHLLPKMSDINERWIANKDSSINWEQIEFVSTPEERRQRIIQDIVKERAEYAILSHTWIRGTPGDVIYHDWETRELPVNARGYAKVTKFCEVAARDHGLTLGWMDNVCINKDSSTELDESIRSMYKWYRGASVCISYLSETQTLADDRTDSWFARGWTLQELLAPTLTCFYNKEWTRLGSTDDKDVNSLITDATTITKRELELCHSGKIERIPISRRLEMASRRQVTREEDTSYSLMGVLAVDIPIAYGEGSERAFFRLVREILATKKHILDIFNRTQDESNRIVPNSIDLYARRKNVFDAPDLPTGTVLDQYSPPQPITLTHLGLRMTLLLAPGMLNMLDRNKGFDAFGSISGTYKAFFYLDDHSDPHYCYNILDRRIFSERIPRLPNDTRKYLQQHYVVTFAIVNFGVEDENILLPENCLAFILLSNGAKPGKIKPSDDFRITAAPPAIFKLQHKDGKHELHKRDLARNGLKVMTLYL